jgi:hypothetical protein
MSERRRACLMCDFFEPDVPGDWKPRWSGDTYDWSECRKKIQETKLHQKGACRFNPEKIEVSTNHWCGRFSSTVYSHGETLSNFIWGSYAERLVDDLKKENKELKRLLEHSREVSRGRMTRLKALDLKMERGKP